MKKSGNLFNDPRITNNSIKHQLFIYIQLNNQTVLFYIIQFSISNLFAHGLNGQTVLFDPLIESYHVLELWARVEFGRMPIKGYSTFPKTLGLVSHHQII